MKKVGLGSICVALLNRLYLFVSEPMNIVETGTLRDKEMEQGWTTEERSTLAIARWIAKSPHRHSFWSVDLSESNLAISRTVLMNEKLDSYCQYVRGDSAQSLRQIHMNMEFGWSFVLLDSDTDPRIILNEFSVVEPRMERPSILVIDDVYKGDVNKGKLALPEADRYRYRHWRIGETEVIAFGQEAEVIIQEVAKEMNS
jgi:predicted O-methyltransferase YrrM